MLIQLHIGNNKILLNVFIQNFIVFETFKII